MKEVNEKSVRERILQIEHDRHDIDGGISIREEFELACLRKLLPTMKTNSPNPVDGDIQALIEHIKQTLSVDDGAIGFQVYKIALAALTAEPVAWTSQRSLDIRCKITAFTDVDSATDYGNKIRWESVIALYTAPPAQLLRPVELPDISAGKYYTEEGAFMAFDYKRDLKAAIRAAGGEVKA